MAQESQIQEVKNRTDVVALVSGYVNLKKAGRNYKGLCPFHGEKTPSFMVSPERGIFKCFGCNEGGDVFAFYQKIEGVDFGEALKALADKAGVILKEYKPSPQEKQKEVINQINTLAAKFYNFLLTNHHSGAKALGYLRDRGINDKTIKEWSLGWAPDRWETAFDYLTKKKFATGDIVAAGISLPGRNKGAYDRFRKRIMFPIRNVAGLVVGFSGRILGEGEPKYLNSPDNLVFNKSNNLFGLDLAKNEIKQAGEAVLVEGNLDVISSHQAGIKNVIAPLGTALTEKQVQLLRRFAENLVISFDSDTAGQAAAHRGIDLAEKAGLAVRVADLGEKDPDELIRKNSKLWQEAVKASVPVYDYLINNAVGHYGTGSSGAINKITREVAPYLARIDNEITKSHYERLLAEKLEVTPEAVRKQIEKTASVSVTSETSNPQEEPPLEKYLLALCLQSQTFPVGFETNLIENQPIRALLELVSKAAVKGSFSLKNFSETVPSELENIANEAALLELPEEILQTDEKIASEINSCATRIKELNLRTKLKRLSLSIKQAEINKRNEEVVDLTKTFKVLSQQLSSIEKSVEN